MTDPEEQLFLKDFNDFVKETRENFGQVFKDRDNDHELMADIYRLLGKIKVEDNLLAKEIKDAKDRFHKSTQIVVDAVNDGIDQVQETIGSKPVHIIKRDLTIKDLLSKLKVWRKDHNLTQLPNKNS